MTTKQEKDIARWKIIRRLRQWVRLKRIQRNDRKILKNNEDITIATLPSTLSEALPDDLEERAKETRAFVVTECTGSFNSK